MQVTRKGSMSFEATGEDEFKMRNDDQGPVLRLGGCFFAPGILSVLQKNCPTRWSDVDIDVDVDVNVDVVRQCNE